MLCKPQTLLCQNSEAALEDSRVTRPQGTPTSLCTVPAVTQLPEPSPEIKGPLHLMPSLNSRCRLCQRTCHQQGFSLMTSRGTSWGQGQRPSSSRVSGGNGIGSPGRRQHRLPPSILTSRTGWGQPMALCSFGSRLPWRSAVSLDASWLQEQLGHSCWGI